MSKSDRKMNIFTEFTLLFLFTGFFVFFWFLIFGKTLLMQADGFTQQYPIVVHLRHSLGEFVRGHGFSFWNWSTGIGADKIANYSSIYFDPFTYVMAVFPPKKMDIGYGIAMYLRMYAGGLTMLLYLKKNRMEEFQCLIGSLAYSFFLWVYAAGGQMTFFIPMITFPLLIMAIDEVDRSGKPYFLALIVGYLIGTTPYFAFMMAVVAGTYSIVRYFFLDRKKSVVDFLKRFGILLGGIGLGALLALPLLSIVIPALAHSPKGEESFVPRVLYSLKEMLLIIPAFFTDHQFMKNYSAMHVSPVILAMFPALVLNLRNKRDRYTKLLTVMFFVCLVFLIFPIFSSIMNGFNYPHARWIFMFQFFFIAAGCRTISFTQFAERAYQRSFLKGFVIYLTVVGFFLATGTFLQLFNTSNLIFAAISIACMCFTVFLLIYPGEKVDTLTRRLNLILLCIVSIAAPYFMYFSQIINGSFTDRMDAGMTYKTFERSVLKDLASFDDDFYRVDINDHVNGHTHEGYADYYHYLANDSMYYNTPTTYYYVSTIDSSLYEYNRMLNNNDGSTTRVISFSNDGRARLDFLQGVRYIAATPDNQKGVRSYGFDVAPELGNQNRVVFKNRFDVSLGYVYPEYITESELLARDPLGREQALMQAAVVSDDYQGIANHKDPGELIVDVKELDFKVEKSDGVKLEGNKIVVSKAKGVLEFRFEDLEDSELFVYIENLNRIPVTYEDLKKRNIKEDSTLMDKGKFLYKYLLYEPTEDFEFFAIKDGRRERLMDYTGKNNQAVLATTNYLRDLGYYKSAKGTAKLQFYTTGTYSLDDLKFFAVSEKHFEEQADRLVSNRLNVSEVGNDFVKGTVDSEGGILYLSILDAGGWKAYVDGQKTELRRVNTAYIGFDVTPGHHEIELRYTPPGWPVAWIGTALGAVIFIGLIVYFRKKETVKDPVKEKESAGPVEKGEKEK